ncbi:mucin-15 isoform X2 [Hemibagrus wyckioides]|nr:mucin-15 isoform X2 [Hemibagrus wyckioides]
MPLGIAFAVLLTLQLVSTQTSYPNNEEPTPIPVNGIPDEWNRQNGILPVEDPGTSSGSMTYSGDGEVQAGNQTVRTVTEQHDENMKTTPLPQTTLNAISNHSSQENDMSKPVTPNPSLEPATTSDSRENLTGTTTTSTSPGNSTTASTTTTVTKTNVTSTAASNNSSSSASGNFTTTTTSPPQVTDFTSSENSTNTTVSTTTTVETSASTTEINKTGGLFDFRENMNKGLSDIQQQSKNQAWGAILGIGVGVAIVALVVYIIVKRRNYRDFSHRKLVEDMPPEPVLRLENSEPLDLKFDGFAYYNPGLQGDNIQMTNFPQGRTN